MANNIDDSASFSSANMKPDNNEETAALWAQNIADNTGYLYYEPKMVCSFSVTARPLFALDSPVGTLYLKKLPGFNTLHGSVTVWHNTEHVLGTGSLYVNNALVAELDYGSVSTVYNASKGFSYDVSSFTNYSDYEVAYNVDLINPAVDHPVVSFSASIWGTFV